MALHGDLGVLMKVLSGDGIVESGRAMVRLGFGERGGVLTVG